MLRTVTTNNNNNNLEKIPKAILVTFCVRFVLCVKELKKKRIDSGRLFPELPGQGEWKVFEHGRGMGVLPNTMQPVKIEINALFTGTCNALSLRKR